ncbi:MAG: alpha/beta hydrolase [Alphaproteobacteria bacterium]|nr:alpha/beta hydrolase [Alphaproteobacteria bacterium]
MSEVFISSFDSRLEGRYHQSSMEGAPLVILLHPEPKLRETMNNKVVYTLYQTFVSLGFSVLRFNFRGVGKSTGEVNPEENWQLSDAITALDWIQAKNLESTVCWVAGVGQGSFVGMQLLMRRPELSGFVSVSPYSHSADYSFLVPCPASGIIVQDGKSGPEIEAQSRTLAERLNAQKHVKVDYLSFPEADIQYTHYLKPLYDVLKEKIPEILKHKAYKNRKSSVPFI